VISVASTAALLEVSLALEFWFEFWFVVLSVDCEQPAQMIAVTKAAKVDQELIPRLEGRSGCSVLMDTIRSRA
jgi:hypothetical protein